MSNRFSTPLYCDIPHPEAHEILAALSRRTAPANYKPPAKSASFRPLYLNKTPSRHLSAILSPIPGIGIRSINKILTARDISGDFHSPADFDRRVKRLKFSRFSALCEGKGWRVVLGTTEGKLGTCEQDVWLEEEEDWRWGTMDAGEDVVTIATWNTGRMSRGSTSFCDKLHHMERLVRESGVEILLLQELCRGVLTEITDILQREGDLWEVFESGVGDASLGMVYRSDRVEVEKVRTGVPEMIEGFLRVPEVAILRRVGEEKAVVVINVHLWQKYPWREVNKLAGLVGELRKVGSVMVAGDFNVNADSGVFEGMRELGMVEIVRPKGKEWNGHPFTVLQSVTTVGGGWLDNFWVDEDRRGDIVDAWVFEFGGRGKRLRQSGHQFAAEHKSQKSDHFPVVTQMRL
eukprot:GFKZ01001167.1.p1 GENE.GFKZ01001167.1~~GFKZ01001167.1.p1  ORF type:complete len:405 (+),score=54.15 GFKZ01001167.1:308-1522(+)